MKILLIFPKHAHGKKFLDFGRGMLVAPSSLITLAACTPPEFDVEIIDEYIDIINYEEKIDLVGITANSFQAKRAYEIASEYRKRRVPVIMGGIHASMLPEEARQFVDSVVVGEAEDLWPQLLNDFQKGALKQIYYAEQRPDLQKLVIPRWDLLKLENYGTLTIQTTRGCPYSCEFCTVQKFNGNKYRRKPIANIVKELNQLKKFLNHKPVLIVDDNITADRKFAKELFKALIPFKIRWACQSPGKIADDDELLKLMKESGCTFICIGFESIAVENIAAMNKAKVNQVGEYENYIRKIHEAGISVMGSFIVGNDFDTEESLKQLPEFIEKNNIVFSSISTPIPFPGTELLHRLKEEKRLVNDDFWLNGDAIEPPLLTPKNITRKGLRKFRAQALQRLHNIDSLYSRLIKAWQKGILVDKGFISFFRTKFYMTILFYRFLKDKRKRSFLLKCMFTRFNPEIISIIMALNSYSYACELSLLEA